MDKYTLTAVPKFIRDAFKESNVEVATIKDCLNADVVIVKVIIKRVTRDNRVFEFLSKFTITNDYKMLTAIITLTNLNQMKWFLYRDNSLGIYELKLYSLDKGMEKFIRMLLFTFKTWYQISDIYFHNDDIYGYRRDKFKLIKLDNGKIKFVPKRGSNDKGKK